MAQLPPKVPNMTPNWPDFPHQRMTSIENLPPNTAAATTTSIQNPSWVEEFLDFSAGKRGSHRRSISDSIAFIEPPMADECRRSLAPGARTTTTTEQFERFDDEQFMSMFVDEITAGPTKSSSNTSTPSDHTSINDDDQKPPTPLDHQMTTMMKNEPDEVESLCNSEGVQVTNNKNNATTFEHSPDKMINDPKRVKRILANRQSAQRSRVRKLQYISELERSVTSLQAEVSVLSPRVAFLDHQRLILNVDNSAIKQRIAALAQDKIFKDAHQEALRREIERLRKVYQEQNINQMDNNNNNNNADANDNVSVENEQLLN